MKEEVSLRRRLDVQRSKADAAKLALKTLQDKLGEMTLDHQGAVNSEESPQMRKIRIFENRLDKAMIKYNEAQSIRKTYEQIVKRLKDERVGYENQLSAIERSLKGKEHDYEELLLLSHDAKHAKEMTENELRRFEVQISAERMIRNKEVDDIRTKVQERVEANTKMEKNEKVKAAFDNKTVKMTRLPTSITSESEAQHKVEEERVKITDYEEAFKRIKEATGVADVNEVIQKVSSQEDTLRNLEELKRENQQKLDRMQAIRDDLKKEVDAIRYAGSDNMTRKQFDEVEESMNSTQLKYEKNKMKHERVSGMITDLKAGIEHMAERLEFYKLRDQMNIIVTDENLIEGLAQCEQKIYEIYKEVRHSDVFDIFQQEKSNIRAGETAEIASTILAAVQSVPQLAGNIGILEPGLANNCRINVGLHDDEELSDDAIEEEFESDVLDRKKMKEEAKQRIEKANKAKRAQSARTTRRSNY